MYRRFLLLLLYVGFGIVAADRANAADLFPAVKSGVGGTVFTKTGNSIKFISLTTSLYRESGDVSKDAQLEFGYERTTSLPTAGVIVKSCFDECSICEPEVDKKIQLDLQRMDLENQLLAKKIELLEKSQEYRCCPAGEKEGEA